MFGGNRSPQRNANIQSTCLLVILAVLIVSANLVGKNINTTIKNSNEDDVKATQSVANIKALPKAEVLTTDLIYKKARSIFVIPEYRLVFFTFPKVACSEWKRMFMRINGNPNWCKIRGFDAHDPKNNQISTLSDYPIEIATAMMTSPSWTRAAIVREPKERVLSAFLDKAVKENYYARKCCDRLPEDDKKLCKDNQKDFKSFLTFVMKYPKKCFDVHWEPQMAKVDKKWWPYIDYIGFQNDLLKDSKAILESLTSVRDPVEGRNAWERYGQTGWGNDNELCEKRPHSFLEENTSAHNLDSGSKMMEWYTPETEKMVEEGWAIEWEQKEVNFPKVNLFPDQN